MKIALLRVPTVIDASASTAPITPPIGLAYLKRVINAFSTELQILDAIGNAPATRLITHKGRDFKLLGETKEELVAQLEPKTELLLISMMFSQDWPYALDLIAEAKERCPNALFVAGGEHISALPEYSLEQCPALDMSVMGEGEGTLAELLERLQASPGELPLDLAGTWARSPGGELVSNERRERIRKIDEIRRPDWNGFPLENYLAGGHGFGVNLGRTMPILASRGCPYQCTFCSNPQMWTTLWKSRDPEDVLDEMGEYIARYQVANFDFYDLTAIVKKAWIVEFCTKLIQRNYNVTWQLPSGTRSEAIDREVAGLLHKSGCRNLSYAPESGSPEILRRIKKKIKLPRMLQSMEDCVAEGLSVKANIICGFPYEERNHLYETLRFIARLALTGCDDLSINQFSPYPGSELFDDLVATGRMPLDERYFVGLSYYSSMTNAQSYAEHLSDRELLTFKMVGTGLFYGVAFARRPWRLLKVASNVARERETTRLEKTLVSYVRRVRTTTRRDAASALA